MLPFIASTAGDRYLRVIVTRDKNRRNRDQLLALIGHELRHAIEVIEHEEVVDVATMESLYRRIGTPMIGGVGGYETSAARVAEYAVFSELLGKRTPRYAGRRRSSAAVCPARLRRCFRACGCSGCSGGVEPQGSRSE
jgi:hypothetical protein